MSDVVLHHLGLRLTPWVKLLALTTAVASVVGDGDDDDPDAVAWRIAYEDAVVSSRLPAPSVAAAADQFTATGSSSIGQYFSNVCHCDLDAADQV